MRLVHNLTDLKVRGQTGLVLEAHRLLYHSTLGLRVITKKKGTDIRDSVAVAFHGTIGVGAREPGVAETETTPLPVMPLQEEFIIIINFLFITLTSNVKPGMV